MDDLDGAAKKYIETQRQLIYQTSVEARAQQILNDAKGKAPYLTYEAALALAKEEEQKRIEEAKRQREKEEEKKKIEEEKRKREKEEEERKRIEEVKRQKEREEEKREI